MNLSDDALAKCDVQLHLYTHGRVLWGANVRQREAAPSGGRHSTEHMPDIITLTYSVSFSEWDIHEALAEVGSCQHIY